LSDIGFIDKAFNDPELLICKNLLMDWLPDRLELFVTTFVHIDAF
jgi:hypothetical protein